jgi:hydroxypyruvate isomerase
MTNRRTVLKTLAAGSVAIPASKIFAGEMSESTINKPLKLKGNINHSVCQWTYNFLSVEELCKLVKSIGFNAIDLISPKDFPTLQKYGIYSSMCYTNGDISLTKGWNHAENHTLLTQQFTEAIPLIKQNGYTDIICFSGSRDGMDDETGLKNCVAGLKPMVELAEKHGVTMQMELLNSKVDHHDYMCDNHKWGVELCKRIGSDHFKLLYDIYHMQIDEGDVIRTIRDNHQYFGHYHTGGVPGRHEIDESQELYYPAIMKAIVETGFKGYVAQEFIPAAKDKAASLKKAIEICDV